MSSVKDLMAAFDAKKVSWVSAFVHSEKIACVEEDPLPLVIETAYSKVMTTEILIFRQLHTNENLLVDILFCFCLIAIQTDPATSHTLDL